MTDRCECGHEADEHDATGHCQAAMLDDAGVSGPCYCDLYDPEGPESPAEEDVKALAQDLAHTSNVGSDFEDDTPLGPQARYYTEAGVGQAPYLKWWILDREGEMDAIRTDTPEDAERVALCLNLDAKYEDGIEAEVERLRLRADAFQAKFEEQCQQGDDMFISHYKAIKRAVTAEAELEDARAELIRELEDRDLERDLFAARVKELEANLATTNRHYAKVKAERDKARAEVERLTVEIALRDRAGVDPDAVLPFEKDPVAVRLGFREEEAAAAVSPTDAPDPLRANRCQGRAVTDAGIGGRCEQDQGHSSACTLSVPTPDDATGRTDAATEPLFTGKVRGRRSLMGMKHLDWVQIAPAYREDFPFDRLDIDDLVDVYPHGQRPAAPAQAVTTEMVYGAIEAAGVRDGLNRGDSPAYIRPCDWTSGETLAVVDALNRSWQIGQVEAWGWRPATSAAPADCTGACGDGACNCSGEYRVLSWAPPTERGLDT